ncbi:hypothetical protein B0H17DRAFT_1145038 [Mycena rosella]|uniref:Uncharacterized protein n=1 Tax=Mycena rosella TaxID=1033263 RepID=A0AAD7G6E7_MYCRO|nr:hypothetical protein B0H17DRAFT_1145038 [Mycena rosella]
MSSLMGGEKQKEAVEGPDDAVEGSSLHDNLAGSSSREDADTKMDLDADLNSESDTDTDTDTDDGFPPLRLFFTVRPSRTAYRPSPEPDYATGKGKGKGSSKAREGKGQALRSAGGYAGAGAPKRPCGLIELDPYQPTLSISATRAACTGALFTSDC